MNPPRKITKRQKASIDNDDEDMVEYRRRPRSTTAVKILPPDINPTKYLETKFIGRGDTLNGIKQIAVTGETSEFGDSSQPDFHQHGPRKFGGSQPGSEKLNFYPETAIYNLVDNFAEFHITPTNITTPGFDETIQFNIEQQNGNFLDANKLEFEMELEMYYKEVPWTQAVGGLAEASRKCISPVNNVAASLFKSITVNVNNQPLITYKYSSVDYFSTVFQTTLDRYTNGDLVDKGFFKENAGALDEWDGLTESPTAGQAPICTKNEGRQELLRLFWNGQKRTFFFTLLCPITQSLHNAPMNFGNRLSITFQRHPNTFYLLSGPDGLAAPFSTTLATEAKDCRLRISKMQVNLRTLQYNRMLTHQYIQSYTDVMPDTYIFPFHKIQEYSYQPGDLEYVISLSTETVPDVIAIGFREKAAVLGDITKNPYVLKKLPKGTQFQVLINTTSPHTKWNEDTHTQYNRLRKSLNSDTISPLISYHDYLINDKKADGTGDCQYNLYCDRLTLTQKTSDGTIYQDTRQAAVTIHIKLPAGKALPAGHIMEINTWDFRKVSFENDGTVVKNYNQ